MKILKNTIGSIVLLVAALFVFTACSTVSVGSVDYEKYGYTCSGSFTVKVSGGDAEYINYDIMLYNGNELLDTTHIEKDELGSKDDSGYYTVNLYVFCPDGTDEITNIKVENVEVWSVGGPTIAFAVLTAAAAVATAVIIAVAVTASRKSR